MDTAVCEACGGIGLHKGSDGFVYCQRCGAQSMNFVEEEGELHGDFVMARERNVQRMKQEQQLKQMQNQLKGVQLGDDNQALLKILSQNPDDLETMEEERKNLASKFSNVKNVRVWSSDQEMYDPAELPDRVGAHIREYYVQGMQKMLQMMCKALVESCGVHPSVCGFAGSIWLNFVASTRVFEKSWVSEVVLVADDKKIKSAEDETTEKLEPEPKPGVRKIRRRRKVKEEKFDRVPLTKTKRRVSVVCVQSLQERLPLRVMLSILFLGCHVAREPVLPSDISEWATDGTLPYLTAFLAIPSKRFFGPELDVIPLPEAEPRALFRPDYLSNGRTVEVVAGYIANRIGLELPPVNFHAISARFLTALGLEAGNLMSYLIRLYEWYTPEELWLSARHISLPSRAHAMAMVIVMLKLVYSIDGHARSSLLWPSVAKRLATSWSSSHRARFQSVLDIIEKRLLENAMKTDFDLKKYLKYCREVVFPGLDIPPDEEAIYNHLWSFFDKEPEKDEPHEAEAEEGDEEDEEDEQAEENEENDSESERNEAGSEQSKPDAASSKETSSRHQHSSAGSAAWSRAAGQKTKSKEQEAEDNQPQEAPAEEALEEEALEVEPVPERREEEVSSASEEVFRIQQAKYKLLRAIYLELTSGNFKLIPGSAVEPPSPEESSSRYTMFQMRSHKYKHKKHVLGDYFMLLFACSRVSGIKCNVLHRCVVQIDEDLEKLEKAVVESAL